MSRKKKKDIPMNEIFAKQLGDETFTRVVTFIVKNKDKSESVVSWKKSKLHEIADKFEYVGTEANRLPRFVEK